jgi:hypothetical protein
MIVARLAGATRVVSQADHAALAAEILGLLRLAGLARHPRRPLLLAAVRAHDDGWWESDAAPRLAPDGRGPLDFRQLDAASRREVWQRSVDRQGGRNPYGAALVATHFLRLAAPLAGDDSLWSAWVAATQTRRRELAEAAGTPVLDLDADADWLALADQLSLAVVARDASLVRAPSWRVRFRSGDPDELALDPFPLAGSTRLRYGARVLPERSFADPVELGAALAGARWQRVEIRLVAFEP